MRRSAGVGRWILLLAFFFISSFTDPVRAAPGKDQAESQKEPTGFYSMTFGRSGLDLVVAQYWSRGPLLRSVTVVAGHPIVTLVNGEKYYTYDALTREGYVIQRSKQVVAQDRDRIRPFATDLEELIEAGGEKVREENLNGIGVDVYRLTDEAGRRTLWVTQNNLQLPIKMEAYDRSSGRMGELDWIQWIPGISVPESFFEVPSNLDLQVFDGYVEYLKALSEGAVAPSPPLFNYLLHVPGESE